MESSREYDPTSGNGALSGHSHPSFGNGLHSEETGGVNGTKISSVSGIHSEPVASTLATSPTVLVNESQHTSSNGNATNGHGHSERVDRDAVVPSHVPAPDSSLAEEEERLARFREKQQQARAREAEQRRLAEQAEQARAEQERIETEMRAEQERLRVAREAQEAQERAKQERLALESEESQRRVLEEERRQTDARAADQAAREAREAVRQANEEKARRELAAEAEATRLVLAQAQEARDQQARADEEKQREAAATLPGSPQPAEAAPHVAVQPAPQPKDESVLSGQHAGAAAGATLSVDVPVDSSLGLSPNVGDFDLGLRRSTAERTDVMAAARARRKSGLPPRARTDEAGVESSSAVSIVDGPEVNATRSIDDNTNIAQTSGSSQDAALDSAMMPGLRPRAGGDMLAGQDDESLALQRSVEERRRRRLSASSSLAGGAAPSPAAAVRTTIPAVIPTTPEVLSEVLAAPISSKPAVAEVGPVDGAATVEHMADQVRARRARRLAQPRSATMGGKSLARLVAAAFALHACCFCFVTILVDVCD